MNLEFISIIFFVIQLQIFLSWFYIPFKNYNFKLLNTTIIKNIFNINKFSKFTFITNFIILIYMLFFVIVSFYRKLMPIFTFFYPFVFMLSILLTLLFYCADYIYHDNIFNAKISKNLIIDECICHLVHFVSTLLVLLVLVIFKMNNLNFFTNNKVYLLSIIFLFYYILKLCAYFKNYGSFNYKIIDIIYEKYGENGLNILVLLLFSIKLLVMNVGIKIIN